jgi:putative flippase GtrA
MQPAIQFVLFCLVGVATTAIDFAVFNVLTRPSAGRYRLPVIPANIISVSAAMTWSFLANWLLVFHPSGQEWLQRAGRFLATTAFSAFVLQNVILYLTTHAWKAPVQVALFVARRLNITPRITEEAVARNTCKAIAVSAGLVWNFCWYKFFVYAAN